MKNAICVLAALVFSVAAAWPLKLAAQTDPATGEPVEKTFTEGPVGAASAPSPASSSAPPAQALVPPETLPHGRIDTSLDNERSDLWQRIREGFAMPDLQSERVRSWERYYAGKPDYVQRMTSRGSLYLFHIVEEVEKRGLPLELALLPFVESAFNPQAMSSAKASGIWQFMPATGKDFALRQNLFRDDRRDVLASTRAALDYLERLHKLTGDWHLALAAYNWGQGNVLRAMAVNRNQGKSTGYDHLSMPDETRNYVPKLQAIKNLVMKPEALGLQLPELENHPYFRSVGIERDIDVAKAADLAGLSLEEFKALNPQMNKPVILAAGTPQVLLPYSNANRFLQQLNRTGTSLATWTAWVVPRTLKPAEAARYVGMTEDHLREVNRIPERMLVKAGSTLLVPRSNKLLEDVASHVADNATIMLSPEARPVRRVAFKAGRKGESVASVARRHGLSPAAVAGWNKLPVTGQFKAGQQVVVMLPVVPGRGAAGPVAQTAAEPRAGTSASGANKAQPGRAQTVAQARQRAGKRPAAATVNAKREAPAKARTRTAAKARQNPPRGA